MKTLKWILLIFMIGVFGSTFAQSTKPATKAEAKPAAMTEARSAYFVQVPHTKEQCMSALKEMKNKGESVLSKFEYGCISGDHTAYGFLEGKSVEDVKLMLPASEQADAKIVKVKKFTVAEIEKMHQEKEHM